MLKIVRFHLMAWVFSEIALAGTAPAEVQVTKLSQSQTETDATSGGDQITRKYQWKTPEFTHTGLAVFTLDITTLKSKKFVERYGYGLDILTQVFYGKWDAQERTTVITRAQESMTYNGSRSDQGYTKDLPLSGADARSPLPEPQYDFGDGSASGRGGSGEEGRDFSITSVVYRVHNPTKDRVRIDWTGKAIISREGPDISQGFTEVGPDQTVTVSFPRTSKKNSNPRFGRFFKVDYRITRLQPAPAESPSPRPGTRPPTQSGVK